MEKVVEKTGENKKFSKSFCLDVAPLTGDFAF
jgi:hypothetical protein